MHPQSRHSDTFLTLVQTGKDRRFEMPYIKTFDFNTAFLSSYHAQLGDRLHDTGMIDIGIEGWLLTADAMKLYEMAYCVKGDILELGSYRGLSATVMNQACNDSGRETVIVSVDLDPDATERSKQQLQAQYGGARANFFTDEAGRSVRNSAKSKRLYGFAFVDHSHEYEHVLDVCEQLHRVVEIGGFALFHDFNDPRNAAPDAFDYGVYQGVMDGLKADRWEFWGIYGCTSLFRRTGPC